MSDTAHLAIEPTTADRPSWTVRRTVPRWMVVAAALLLASVVTGVLVQVSHPFIRHDDWASTLPGDAPGSSGQLARNRFEGRWLNTVYWIVVGQWTSIVVASVFFFAAYCAFTWGFVRLFRLRGRVSLFTLTLAVFLSPVWVRLVYWPGTLSASFIVAAAAVWTLPWARRRRTTLVAWLLAFIVLAVLAYPPVAALVFFALVVTELRSPPRRLALVAAGFVVAYGVGVLAVYTLNWLAFREFGLTISAWRHPNPLVSVDALMENLSRYGHQFAGVSEVLGWAGLIALASLVWALVDASTRRLALVALGGVAVVVGLEAALTIYSGVVTGPRASLWAWPAACLPAALLLKGTRVSRWLGAVALVGIAIVGCLTWRSDLGEHQQTRVQYDAVAAEVASVVAAHPDDNVVMWIQPQLREHPSGVMTAVTLQQMLYDQYGIFPHWCKPLVCASIAEAVAEQPRARVLRVEGLTVLRLPRPPAWL
jgi:MFS family permease